MIFEKYILTLMTILAFIRLITIMMGFYPALSC
ncbi:MAG: hypothetical protein ETSY1_44090 [Candidatus Entotheonella factor]|uniref:Uncharacterized protein n=1 Tax=Entotheonella factor TaxID=1429438 RepID=W4L3V9_ENTF1|nr:MAG: hypothetical protein ETSY1_44090 [Candidatus Entotheonella factor]